MTTVQLSIPTSGSGMEHGNNPLLFLLKLWVVVTVLPEADVEIHTHTHTHQYLCLCFVPRLHNIMKTGLYVVCVSCTHGVF